MLAKPFGELFGEIPPLLRIADGASSRRDRQHRSPERGTIDRHHKSLLRALRMLCEVRLNHLRQLRGRLCLLGYPRIERPRIRFNRKLGRYLLLHVNLRQLSLRYRLMHPEYLPGKIDDFLVVLRHAEGPH